MFIDSVPFWLNGNGGPGTGYRVFIGRPNTDPTQEENKLQITDGINGKPVSNPFYISGDGLAKNAQGNAINPYVDANEYCIEYRTPTGTYGALKWQNRHYRAAGATTSSPTETSTNTIDFVIDNFALALTLDLSDYDTIYIKSYAAGWQATSEGPSGDFYAYRTGSTGSPGTGNPGAFFDSAGNEWKPFVSQKLYAEMFGAKTGIGNDSFQAFKDMLEASSSVRAPCYAEGDLYLINTQVNTDSNYSLFDKYAMKLPDFVDFRGGGSTVIKNASVASGQYMFVAEDCEYVSFMNCELNGNAGANILSGALYVAGCDYVYLDCRFNDSAPLYLTASTIQQTLKVRGNIEVTNAESWAVSVNSAGARDIDFDRVLVTNSDNGIYLSSKDIDAHAVVIELPLFKVNRLDLVNVTKGMEIVSGDFVFGEITGKSITTGFDFQVEADINKFIGSNIYMEANTLFNINLITGGIQDFSVDGVTAETDEIMDFSAVSASKIITNMYFGNLYARGTDVNYGISITNTAQTVEKAVFDNVDLDGYTRAFNIGDDTQTGTIDINNGDLNTCATGVYVDTTNGHDINIGKVDFTGCTTRENGMFSKCNWRSEGQTYQMALNSGMTGFSGTAPKGWSVSRVGTGQANITHNLGHTNYAISGSVKSNRLTYQISSKQVNLFQVIPQTIGGSNIDNGMDLVVHSLWYRN